MSPTTFKSTFLPLSRRLYVTAWRLSGNAQDAEDLVQETLMKLWEKRNLMPDMTNTEAYSVTMLVHIFYDNRRRQHLKTADAAMESLHIEADDDTVEALDRSEKVSRVGRLIEKLPAQQRKVMTLRDIDSLSFDEIGTSTGLSQNNIRSLLSRARKAIRAEIHDDD